VAKGQQRDDVVSRAGSS